MNREGKAERAGRIYRPDIDGLRGIAVLAVVVYHAFPEYLRGGFAGVDVFFVISGYLITNILRESLREGTFDIRDFYRRRVRRIFPALLVCLAFVYAFGWFTLLGAEYQQLGKHVAAGATFLSNWVLWNEVGYFNNSVETKPLVHLWSLCIEEQFYIAWPIILWFASVRRFSLRNVTIALAFLSFLLCLWCTKRDPVGAFYFPFTRFWELLVGGIFAGSARRVSWASGWLSMAGISLLLTTFVFFHGDLVFPGAWALLPVAGTLFAILAGPQAPLNRVFLANPLLVSVGLISYPLYLWHWPLLSYSRILGLGVPPAWVRSSLVALALALAWLTYFFVERPVRFGGRQGIRAVVLVVPMLILGLVGFLTFRENGFPSRAVVMGNAAILHPSDAEVAPLIESNCSVKDPMARRMIATCARDRRGKSRFALLGDSKASALFLSLVRTSNAAGRWEFFGGSNAYGPFLPLVSDDAALARFQPMARRAVVAIANDSDVETVVIASAVRVIFQLAVVVNNEEAAHYDYHYLRLVSGTDKYALALAALAETIHQLSQAGKKVVLVFDNPPLPNAADCVPRAVALPFASLWATTPRSDCQLPLAQFREETKNYRRLLDSLAARFPHSVRVFDPTSIYCDSATGICPSLHNGKAVYSITDHISGTTALEVGAKLNSFLAPEGASVGP